MILKPCPFCGAHGHALIESCRNFEAGTEAYIHCNKCGAKGPSEYSELGEPDAQNKARAAWNRRRNSTKGTQK